ncbi:hypothetical protein [Hyalangium versicolor]|uniref:hypothetical protein n=1 Tax=Hyalangium versicolor TaxID=2861190 RepID=UPI001CCA415D|nr:hypothetical protein [Hyalangium versicolor]
MPIVAIATLRLGYARCVSCFPIFLESMLRREHSQLWCPWCLEPRLGTPHGTADAASCECRWLTQ